MKNLSSQMESREFLREKLSQSRLYCITAKPAGLMSIPKAVESACRGGADVIQLREKDLSAKDLIVLGKQCRPICHEQGSLFIVNDRLDVALACGADGVHLGQSDVPLRDAKEVVRRFFQLRYEVEEAPFLIGVSTHSLAQALAAQSQGADYVGCGPVFSTPTKPGVAPVGLNLVRQYRENLSVPFVTIGGIDASNIGQVMAAGACCVAVVRAVFADAEIEQSARNLKSKLTRGNETN
ncbi:MAG: thiamine phosphate synthase [Elusimicrobia bacterium]|nr:thiamine phosphate synthase [Elusimicrobiota bacterium]